MLRGTLPGVPMEVLLQVWDELDDLLGCLRQAWLGLDLT